MNNAVNRLSIQPVALAAAVSLLVTPSAATVWSQEAPRMLEEVVVTAQKREQTLEDIPGSVSVLSGEALDRSNTSNLSDLGKISAGIRLESPRDGNSPVLRIRGIGTQRFNPAVSPSVGVFVDEIAKERIDSAFTNLSDVARIEVLKGPQATLYGKQVSAGALSIITNKPHTDEIEGKLQAKLGNNDLQEYRGTLNLPLGERVAARLNGYYTQSAFEQVENVVTGDSEETETAGARLRLLFQPSLDLEAILTLEHHEGESRDVSLERVDYGPAHLEFAAADGVSLLAADPFDGKVQVAAPTGRQSETDAAALHLSWDFSDHWSLSSITSYESFKRDPDGAGEMGAGDGAMSALTGAAVVVGPAVPGALFFTNVVDDDAASQELRFTYEGDQLSSIVGVFWSESNRSDTSNLVRRVTPALATPILSDLDRDSEDYAIFSHNTWRINPDYDLTFGLRYAVTEKEDQSGTIVGGGFYGDPDVDPVIPTQADDWEAFSGTLKLTYHVSDDVSAYAGYDRGYKAGGFNSLRFRDGTFTPAPAFDEEIADNFEVGVKGRFFDNMARWSLAAFYQVYEDFQLPIPDPVSGVGLITQNAGKVISQGFETELTWLLDDYWSLDASLAYIDSTYDDYSDAPCYGGQDAPACVDGFQDLSDERVDNHSPWTATLNLTYEDTLGDTGITWYARAESAYKDDFIGLVDHDPRAEQSSYTLFNASVGLNAPDDSWTLTLWGKNLTDEEYASTFLKAADDGIPGNASSILLRPGDEISYGVDLTYRF